MTASLDSAGGRQTVKSKGDPVMVRGDASSIEGLIQVHGREVEGTTVV